MLSTIILVSLFFQAEVRTISQGQGNTESLARHEAFRNAVEQVVGSYIDSKTLVSNSVLISDSILNFSNGYIKSYDQIDTRNENGTYKVKISALVESYILEKKISGLGISMSNVNTANIVAEIKTKIDLEKQKKRITDDIMNDFPKKAYNTIYQKMALDHIDGDNAFININFLLSNDKVFYQNLNEFCKKIAIQRGEKGSITAEKITRASSDSEDSTLTVYFSTTEELKVGSYSNSVTILKSDAFFADPKYWPTFTIRAKDLNGNVLATGIESNTKELDEFNSLSNVFSHSIPPNQYNDFPSKNLFSFKRTAKPLLPFCYKTSSKSTKGTNIFIVSDLQILLTVQICVSTDFVEKIAQIEIETK